MVERSRPEKEQSETTGMPGIPVAHEVFYKVGYERMRESFRQLEEQLISVGIILPEKAKMLIRGALFRHAVKETIINLSQSVEGNFDFSDVINKTEMDLMEWVARQSFGIIEPIDPSRN
jgi:hypothetical protein